MTKYLKTLLNFKNIIVLILLITLGCGARKLYFDLKNVEKIRFFYLPKRLNPNHSINKCNEIFSCPKEILKDTIITDKNFIHSFVKYINILKPSKKSINYDFRIKCLIKGKNGKINKVCFGEDYLILLDGKLMQDEKKIFELINKTLY